MAWVKFLRPRPKMIDSQKIRALLVFFGERDTTVATRSESQWRELHLGCADLQRSEDNKRQ